MPLRPALALLIAAALPATSAFAQGVTTTCIFFPYCAPGAQTCTTDPIELTLRFGDGGMQAGFDDTLYFIETLAEAELSQWMDADAHHRVFDGKAGDELILISVPYDREIPTRIAVSSCGG